MKNSLSLMLKKVSFKVKHRPAKDAFDFGCQGSELDNAHRRSYSDQEGEDTVLVLEEQNLDDSRMLSVMVSRNVVSMSFRVARRCLFFLIPTLHLRQ